VPKEMTRGIGGMWRRESAAIAMEIEGLRRTWREGGVLLALCRM